MIKFSAIGDIALFGEYKKIIEKKGIDYPFSLISKYFKERDLTFGNLEVPISDKGKPDSSKPISLCAPPSALEVLKSAKINYVSLANNHSYDFGKEAFFDTQNRLRSANISFMGVGENLLGSRRPVYFKNGNTLIAILAYNSYATNGRNIANRFSGGIAPLEYKFIKSDIQSIKKKHDGCIILISLHWGIEMSNYPTPFQRDLARKLIDKGANLIIGHHPHVLQGIEGYNNGLIVYSLGNFCFPDVRSPYFNNIVYKQGMNNRESIILNCNFEDNKLINYNIVPIIINKNLQPEIVKNKEAKIILKKIKILSAPLKNKNYHNYYKDKVNKKNKSGLLYSIKQKNFSEIVKRINLMYLKAYAIALSNNIKEIIHKKSFYNSIS